MRIIFHWGNFDLDQTVIPECQEQLTYDLGTVFQTDPEEAHVYYEEYEPEMLKGSICDESGKILCNFKCSLFGNRPAKYTFD